MLLCNMQIVLRLKMVDTYCLVVNKQVFLNFLQNYIQRCAK